MQLVYPDRSGGVGQVSILYEADRLCNPGFHFTPTLSAPRFNPLRGRQTLQHDSVAVRGFHYHVSILYEADRLCNVGDDGGPHPRPLVSILYEADRLCNEGPTRRPGQPAVFQSSTRQTDFATSLGSARFAHSLRFQSSTRQTDFATSFGSSAPPPSSSFNPLRGRQTLQRDGEFGGPGRVGPVSILYEADRLCNLFRSCASSSSMVFQSSTRQTDFATYQVGADLLGLFRVSILYEADRLCNEGADALWRLHERVSILYEADRLCNCPCQEAAPDRGS